MTANYVVVLQNRSRRWSRNHAPVEVVGTPGGWCFRSSAAAQRVASAIQQQFPSVHVQVKEIQPHWL